MVKRSLLILFLCLGEMLAYAQTPRILHFEKDPTDLTAQQRNKKDNKGKTCPLLRVLIVDKGTKFAGSLADEVEYLQNEYWVWMNEGATNLSLMTSDKKVLNISFPELGETSLQERSVYVLMVDAGKESTNTGTKHNFLSMKVSPENANVKINGEKVSMRFGTLSQNLPYGEHTYEINAEGFASKKGTFTVYLLPN